MKLFFESGHQATSFLSAVPLGLVAALCVDLNRFGGWGGIVIDVLLMLTFACSLFLMGFCFSENNLRIYHLLGLAIGALLYLQGAAKVFRKLKRLKK